MAWPLAAGDSLGQLDGLVDQAPAPLSGHQMHAKLIGIDGVERSAIRAPATAARSSVSSTAWDWLTPCTGRVDRFGELRVTAADSGGGSVELRLLLGPDLADALFVRAVSTRFWP
jgi:hypothetical protein